MGALWRALTDEERSAYNRVQRLKNMRATLEASAEDEKRVGHVDFTPCGCGDADRAVRPDVLRRFLERVGRGAGMDAVVSGYGETFSGKDVQACELTQTAIGLDKGKEFSSLLPYCPGAHYGVCSSNPSYHEILLGVKALSAVVTDIAGKLKAANNVVADEEDEDDVKLREMRSCDRGVSSCLMLRSADQGVAVFIILCWKILNPIIEMYVRLVVSSQVAVGAMQWAAQS